MRQPQRPKQVVIVDDSAAYRELWSRILADRYGGRVVVESFGHPYDALPRLERPVDLLIVDFEMPAMDGKKFVQYARQKAIPASRIVVTSTHSADVLHESFPMGETIAVINKSEAKQQEAFLMILDSVMNR